MPSQHAATRQPVTFRLDRDVLAAAKAAAAQRGQTMTAVVEEALREYAARGGGEPGGRVEVLELHRVADDPVPLP